MFDSLAPTTRVVFLSSAPITFPKFVLESPVSTLLITCNSLCCGVFFKTIQRLVLSLSTQSNSPTWNSPANNLVFASSRLATLADVNVVTKPFAVSTSEVSPLSVQNTVSNSDLNTLKNFSVSATSTIPMISSLT